MPIASPQSLPILDELHNRIVVIAEHSRNDPVVVRHELESLLSDVKRNQAFNPVLAFSLMALLHALLNQVPEMAGCLRNVEARASRDVFALGICGGACYLTGDYIKAVSFHRKSWNLEKTNFVALYNIVEDLITTGEWREAFDLLTHVNTNNSLLTVKRKSLGHALATLSSHNVEEHSIAKMAGLALSLLQKHGLHCHGHPFVNLEAPMFIRFPVPVDSERIVELVVELCEEQIKHEWAMELIQWVDFGYSSGDCLNII